MKVVAVDFEFLGLVLPIIDPDIDGSVIVCDMGDYGICQNIGVRGWFGVLELPDFSDERILDTTLDVLVDHLLYALNEFVEYGSDFIIVSRAL